MSATLVELSWPRPFPAGTPDEGAPATFGALLATLRRRAGLSQNALADAARVDVSYVNRLEQRDALKDGRPSRRVILALWNVCRADDDDRERLLVAAGLCPQAILDAGGWDAYVAGWMESLEQPHRTHFRLLERRLDLMRAALREQARRVNRLRRELAGDLVRVGD